MDPKENEIDSILHSLDGLQKASANPFIFEKIKGRIETRATPAKSMLRWALMALLIIALNVITWTQANQGTAASDLNPIAGQLGFSNSTYQY